MAGAISFSLDYDDTFTAHPELWHHFVNQAMLHGHKVYCVSARLDHESNHDEMRRALPPGVEIVLCSGMPKRKIVELQELQIDIWIDDCPEAIVHTNEALDAAYNEVERMRLLVEECRQQRDNAKTDAMVELNKEMAELRAEIAQLKRTPTARPLGW